MPRPFSFDSNPEPNPQNLHRGEANGPPKPTERLGHLPGGGLRSSGMPHEGSTDPSVDDGPRFHSNMPISELTERDTQAIKASVVSSAPLVAKTEDRVTHETWPTPTEPHGLGGSSRPILDQKAEVRRLAHGRPEAASCRTKS